jgi:hypothetical protein
MEKIEIDECPVCQSLDFIEEGELNGRIYFKCVCGTEFSYPMSIINEMPELRKRK